MFDNNFRYCEKDTLNIRKKKEKKTQLCSDQKL